MGGPIDTRDNPTGVNKLAETRGTDWFRRNVITKVPFPHPGFMRDVYPGFLQLHGFVSMNLDRHIEAHRKLFHHLVQGDGDSAQKHREFYDEYLAVMDLDGGVLSADGRDRVRAPRRCRRADDPSRPAGRSVAHQARRADDGRGRARRHFRRRADRGRASAVRQHSRRAARRIGCSPTSAITACSTARASAPRSRRASPTSFCRTTASSSAARPRAAANGAAHAAQGGRTVRPARSTTRRTRDQRLAATCAGNRGGVARAILRRAAVCLAPAATASPASTRAPNQHKLSRTPLLRTRTSCRCAPCCFAVRPNRSMIEVAFEQAIYPVQRAPASPGAPLYVAHPGGDPRGRAHDAAARQPQGGARLRRAARRLDRGAARPAAGRGAVRGTAPSSRCAGSITASSTGAARAARCGARRPADGMPLLCVAGDAPHVGRRVADHLKREAKRDLEAASRRYAAAARRRGPARRRSATRRAAGVRARPPACCPTPGASILAPPFVLDYLAAHEVAHLVEMNHSPRFWRIVIGICPDTRRAKAWLDAHGAELHRYGVPE